MTSTPAQQPNSIPLLGDWQPLPNAGAPTTGIPTARATTAPDVPAPAEAKTTGKTIQLTTTQKRLVIGIVIGAVAIAGIGFAGSYMAVTKLAQQKHFGDFSYVFTIGVDVGIVLFLALDLLLTWLRIPFPLLRQIAWMLTAATIAFNAVASWPDPVGVAMHGVIPILFVGAVEAARHAIGRIADIVADKHFENPPFVRWLVAFPSTFRLWRWQRKNNVHSYDRAVKHQREVKIYRARLRQEYGRSWRRTAPADKRLVLTLARFGMSIVEAIELPAREQAKRVEEQNRIERERLQAEDDLRRQAAADEAERERRRREDAATAAQHELEQRAAEENAERQRRLADAETREKLAAIERQQKEREAEEERARRQEQLAHATALAEAEAKARREADARARAEEQARVEAERKADAARRAAEALSRAQAANAAAASANGSANAATASGTAATTSPASATPTASATAANGSASGSANRRPATANTETANPATATAIDLDQVAATYQLLAQQLNKAPSDAKLGEALGVSRSRAQQLRTLAIEAGHAQLAKPVRLAS